MHFSEIGQAAILFVLFSLRAAERFYGLYTPFTLEQLALITELVRAGVTAGLAVQNLG